jgi:hypothetical protein
MLRVEERLLVFMTVRRWLVAIVVVGGVSFVAGREYLKWELRRGLDDAMKQVVKSFPDARRLQVNNDVFADSRAEKARAEKQEAARQALAAQRAETEKAVRAAEAAQQAALDRLSKERRR